MLDTVVLTLTGTDFIITNRAKFGPARPLPGGGERRFQNPTPQEKRAGVTKPALTWSKRPFSRSPELRIEVSVPKMFHGDNLSEVVEADLPAVAERLSLLLAGMGVAASPEVLVRAKVSKIHFSKNILLSAGTTVASVLWALWRVRTSARRDGRETHWDNEGLALRLRTTERELILYDKLADVSKAKWSPKRSIDPLSGALPLGEASDLPAGSVLRIEVRLNKPRTIRSALRQVRRPLEDPRLADMFAEEVSKAILLYELKQFGEGSLAALPDATPDQLFLAFLADGVKADFALKGVGLATIERAVTPISFRKLLKDRAVPDQFWYGLKRFRRPPPSSTGDENVVDMLRRAVDEFKPIRSAPVVMSEVHPVGEYYSDTSSAFS